MEKVEISDEEVFNYVKNYLALYWSKFSGIHRVISFDDFVQDIMLTLYGTGKDGIKRIDKYKSKGKSYFYNVINYIIRNDLNAYTKPKHLKNVPVYLNDKLSGFDDLTIMDTLASDEMVDEIPLDSLLSEISDSQINNYVFIDSDGTEIELSQRFICRKILAGYKVSELVPHIYNKNIEKFIISQTMYNIMKDLRKDIVSLYKRKNLMEVNYLDEHVGRKYSSKRSTC